MRIIAVFAISLVVRCLGGQSLAILPNYNTAVLSATAAMYLDCGKCDGIFIQDKNGRVPALLQLPENVELPKDIQQEARFRNIASIRISQSELKSLATSNLIQYIDVNCRFNRSHPLNDTTRILSHVNEVQNGLSFGLPANYRGQGVVVGIVDIGFQPDNPTNLNAAGNQLRIKRWWDQGNKSGKAPGGFSFGTEYTNPVAILSARNDDGTHGTHVSGIAAGSGYSTPGLKYKGMAPESDLVYVTIKYSNDTLGGSALGDYVVANATILDAFKYIFDYAQSVGKPAVINLSWGMHTGPHDGNSLFDKAVEVLTGPGKIVVGACGNDGGNQMHLKANLKQDTVYTFAYDQARNDYKHENFYCDFWGDSAQSFGINVSLFDTLGNLKFSSPFFYSNSVSSKSGLLTVGKDSLWYKIAANKKFINNGKPEILLMVETNLPQNQSVRIGITGTGRVDGWNSGQTYRWTAGSFSNKVKGNDYSGKYLTGLAEGSAGENGGTGKATITAGAYVARNKWFDTAGVLHEQNWLNVGEIAGFSSRGPTVDGRIKPDIVSPGQNIISAVNYRTYSPWMRDITTYSSVFVGNRQFWSVFSGTSMAAPHVTGIVALMLQVNPNLTPQQIKNILYRTASRDAFTGKDSNNNYGYGKINALESVKMLVSLNTKNPNRRGMRCQIYPNPADNDAVISAGLFAGKKATIGLYDLAGKLVTESKIVFDEFGLADLQLSTVSAGSYLWNIQCTGSIASGRLVVSH
jgi:subtilisin family serine protease